jgi:hypothetical protein
MAPLTETRFNIGHRLSLPNVKVLVREPLAFGQR